MKERVRGTRKEGEEHKKKEKAGRKSEGGNKVRTKEDPKQHSCVF